MPLTHDSSDAELVARVGQGDHAAVDALWERHADAVHDHLARWTQDAELAAAGTVAAFTALLDDVAVGTAPTAVRASLLRTAREHAMRVLERGDHEGPPVPPAVLAATGASTTTAADAAAAWAAAAALGPPWFSALDLSVRQGSSARDLSAVLGQPEAAVDELLATVHRRTDEATRTAYAALATIPAPVAARTAMAAAAAASIGAPAALSRTVRMRALGVVGGIALLILGVGLANALGGSGATPTAGPATAAAEPVPSPSPEVDASPTPTLEPLATPSVVPMASPEPTVPVPSPSPTVAPSPTPTVLTVTIDDPPPGAAFAATGQDAQGRPAAVVPVVATIEGASQDATIAWTTDLAADQTLLTAPDGELLLWLPEECSDAQHVVTVTVDDPVDDRTAAASITVQVLETCEEPPTVTIVDPTGEDPPRDADESGRVSVPVRATSETTGVTWRWSASGATIVSDPLEGPEGTLELEVSCPSLEPIDVTLTVTITRTADETSAQASVPVEVRCPPVG